MSLPAAVLVVAPLLVAQRPDAGARDLSDAFDLPDGLAVTLWAESPHLDNPAAIDVDERGRIWVAEAVNYRTWDGRNPGRRHPEGDRIVVLEDVDGDGACDRSHVFAQDADLVAPLGLAVIAGKVYVSCSPSLFVYEDRDGDGRADRRETLLEGFGGRDHDHGLHSVVGGPDGKLYFAVGNAGPHLVTDRAGWTLRSGSVYRDGGAKPADNKPGLVSDDGRVWTGGLICRVGYDGTGLEVLAHNFRNPYEVAIDAFGTLYTADNDDDGSASCRTTWVLPGGNYGFFSEDGARTWQADRRPGQDTWTAHWHQEDPGVMPAGTRNGPGGPTGCAVYEGELLARWIDGAVLNADAGARAVYAHAPREEGVGIALEKRDLLRPKPGREDLGARWFRPSDVCVGTDGAVYVADWYDPGVGGHLAGDAEAYGRILRIAPQGSDARAPVYDLETAEGRIAALTSPAIHAREAARRVYAARRDELTAELEEALGHETDGRRRWRIHKATGIGRSHVVDWDEVVHPAASTTPLRDDLDAAVDRAREVDPADRVAVEAFGIAAFGLEEEVYARIEPALGAPDPSDWDARFEALASRLHPSAATPAFLARALDPELPAPARRRAIDALAFTGTRAAAEAVLSIAHGGPDDLRDYAAWWIRSKHEGEWREFDLVESLGGGDLARARIAWTSAEIASGLVDVDVDVAGASRLWLVVSDAGNGNACDWADWIAPRFEGEGGTTPLVELPWIAAEAGYGEVRVGRNCIGGPLIAGDVETSDGIGTHARSVIAYAVPEGATRFRAQAGPDAGGVSQGCGTSMVFQVRLETPMPPVPLAAWERALLDAGAQPRDRKSAAVSLARDPSGALRLLQLAEEERVPAELERAIAAAIHENPDLGVRALASARFPRPDAPARGPSAGDLAALVGDARRGRALFLDRARTQCIACHAYTSGTTTLGGDVGPDLTRIGEKYDEPALLEAILDPSAGIAFGYDAWRIETASGRLYAGFVLADGPTLILKDARGERHAIEADDVVDRVKQTVSTMPEGVALGLSAQELKDLVAFLRAPATPTGLLGRERELGPGLRLGDPAALLDGPALDAWTFHTEGRASRADVWSLRDGVLACTGRPIGYLRTKERYTSFHLSLEWRFDPAKGPGNSGVLLRVQPEDKVWPRSIEAQLHSGDAGDVWNIDAFPLRVAEERTQGRRTVRLAPSSEKPLGEWNRYDVWLVGPRLELYVNGVLQNTADWCAEMPGWIALQSEGAAIEFRDVVLTPIAE